MQGKAQITKAEGLPTEEFAKFKEKAFRYLWDEVEPLGEGIERTHRIPRERIWSKLGELGMLGMRVPKEYGGAGLSEVQYLDFEKEWSKIHGGIRVLLHVHNGGNDYLSRGSEEIKNTYLPKTVTGEMSCAFGLTEPDGGSGRDTKTTAKRVGSDFVMNGRKHLITNADFADLFYVGCYTETISGEFVFSVVLHQL